MRTPLVSEINTVNTDRGVPCSDTFCTLTSDVKMPWLSTIPFCSNLPNVSLRDGLSTLGLNTAGGLEVWAALMMHVSQSSALSGISLLMCVSL
jgi:hypothetical protein